MKEINFPQNGARERVARRSHSLWLLAAGGLLILLVALLLPKPDGNQTSPSSRTNSLSSVSAPVGSPRTRLRPVSGTRSTFEPAHTAEEIVAGKVSQFGRSRRDIVGAIGRRLGKEVPPYIEKFFDAVESGDWERIDALWKVMAKHTGQYEKQDSDSAHWPDLDPYWSAVLDAYGVAQQAHLWPAQKLLDYGNAILDSLRPGMVYVGGTDNGRWIPELLNETSGGEPHIIVTQNAFADGRYVDFMNTLYGDRLATLTDEDSKRAFQEYVTDAQKRLEHDQQFPDEPKQIRPGEDVRVEDGRVQVGGQAAVMAINEKLLQSLMARNPDLSFAIQESFPLKGTYADALPLGPLMELGAQDGQNTFTAERAAQSLDYWGKTAQQVFSDPEAASSPEALKSYSHDTVAAANLLAAHNFTAEAEQAYRLAARFWPENPESIGGLADLLVRSGREDEARQTFEEFIRQHPNHRKDLDRVSAAWRVLGAVQPSQP
jgi:hypothetical protein